MKVCLIMAVSHAGVTAHIRDSFLQRLEALAPKATVDQFVLPRDGPPFCLGCKQCFIKDMDACPHYGTTGGIWKAMLACDLLVFILPTYVFGVPGQLKTLLDHFGGRWIVHKPSPQMLTKRALIINQAMGAGLGSTVRQLRSNLLFWGTSCVRALTTRVMEMHYDLVSPRVINRLNQQIDREIIRALRGSPRPGFKAKALYRGMALGQRIIKRSQDKKGQTTTSDYTFWQQQGWLKGQFPWKQKA
ncbi:MAG: flavodoxin family protein [Clostridiales bacterium]|nr:flavodoxin family protein [Clostridiales bacterium]